MSASAGVASMHARQEAVGEILALCPVIPVLTIEDAEKAAPLARALAEGGLRVLEVTLRTDAAIEAIAAMARIEGVVVGAGTVLSPKQYGEVADAGARFCVSPGSSPSVLAAAAHSAVPFLPGAATPTEMLHLLEAGYRYQKFFPAEPAGGIPMLKSIGAPIPEIRFCPTGGITAETAPDYLALGNVICVGGSWLAPPSLVAAGDWSEISRRAAAALALRPG